MDLSPAEWTFFAVAVDLFCRVGGLFEAEYPTNDGNLLDQGYHGWRGSFGLSFNEDGILVLNYGSGGSPPLWSERYYDVTNGRISRFFFNPPVQSHSNLVVYFEAKEEYDGDIVLIIQNMFDPSLYYKEVRNCKNIS